MLHGGVESRPLSTGERGDRLGHKKLLGLFQGPLGLLNSMVRGEEKQERYCEPGKQQGPAGCTHYIRSYKPPERLLAIGLDGEVGCVKASGEKKCLI